MKVETYRLQQLTGFRAEEMPQALKGLSASRQKQLQEEIVQVSHYLLNKKTFETSKICDVCNGTGSVTDEDMLGYYKVQCSCLGKGYVDK